MYQLKTVKTKKSAAEFVKQVEDPDRQQDCRTLLKLMKRLTGKNPVMWGDAMVGFDSYRYQYRSGHQGEWFVIGFSPRKQNLTIYLMCGFETDRKLLSSLGKYKLGKSCLYLKKLDDIDLSVLETILVKGIETVRSWDEGGDEKPAKKQQR